MASEVKASFQTPYKYNTKHTPVILNNTIMFVIRCLKSILPNEKHILAFWSLYFVNNQSYPGIPRFLNVVSKIKKSDILGILGYRKSRTLMRNIIIWILKQIYCTRSETLGNFILKAKKMWKALGGEKHKPNV